MTLCSTTSGPYRCSKEVDARGQHKGACEAQTPEYARRSLFVEKHGYWFNICANTAKTGHALTEHNDQGCMTCQKEKTP